MNAAISYFSGLELLYLAAFDLQIDAEFEADLKERKRKYSKAYYQKHKERARARSRAYYANNTEAILARQLERYHKKEKKHPARRQPQLSANNNKTTYILPVGGGKVNDLWKKRPTGRCASGVLHSLWRRNLPARHGIHSGRI